MVISGSPFRHLVPFVLLDLSAELVLMVRKCLHTDSMFPGTEADGAGEVRPWAAAAIRQSNGEEYESTICFWEQKTHLWRCTWMMRTTEAGTGRIRRCDRGGRRGWWFLLRLFKSQH